MEISAPKIPVNCVSLLEDFIRITHPEYAKNLLKQVYDGVSCPIIRFELKDLSDENLIDKFRKDPQEFFSDCCEALKNIVAF